MMVFSDFCSPADFQWTCGSPVGPGQSLWQDGTEELSYIAYVPFHNRGGKESQNRSDELGPRREVVKLQLHTVKKYIEFC